VARITRSILRLRAKRDRRDELVALFERLGVFAAASEQPGFLGAELQLPLDDDDEVLVTAKWTSPEAYNGWLESGVRAAIGEQLEPLLDEDPKPRAYVIVHERPRPSTPQA
jgi:heme-degrading monooxygenase HmoA